MKRLLCLSVFAAGAATVTGAEPLGIKGFALGEDLRTAASRAGLSCHALPSVDGQFCFHSASRPKSDFVATIAGVPAKQVFISAAEDGKLGSVRYVFKHSDFLVVRGAFEQKYQLSCVDSIVENRMGARFDQTVCTHQAADGKVIIKRRESDLTEGSVEIRSLEYEAAIGKAMQRRKIEGKKDI